MGVPPHPDHPNDVGDGLPRAANAGDVQLQNFLSDFRVKNTFIDFEVTKGTAPPYNKTANSEPPPSLQHWAENPAPEDLAALRALALGTALDLRRTRGVAAGGSEVCEPTLCPACSSPGLASLGSTPEPSPKQISRTVAAAEEAAVPSPRARLRATPAHSPPTTLARFAGAPASVACQMATPLAAFEQPPASNGAAAKQGQMAQLHCEYEPEAPLSRPTRPKTRLVLSEQLVMDSPQKKQAFGEHWSEHFRGAVGSMPAIPAGTMTPTRTPQAPPELTPEPRVAPTPPWPLPLPPVPMLRGLGAGIFFSFTIRRADGQGLGLKVEQGCDNRSIVVRDVCQNGAIDAWNLQCTGPNEYKTVLPGDKIVCVNGVSSCEEMLSEIQAKQLLKLLVVRESQDHIHSDSDPAAERHARTWCPSGVIERSATIDASPVAASVAPRW